MKHTLVLSVLAVAALAGCAAQTPSATPEETAVATTASAPTAPALGANATQSLFLQRDATLLDVPPQAAERMPLGAPANGPWHSDYPTWRGKASAFNATKVELTLFFSSDGANVRASDAFPMVGLPAFYAAFTANGTFEFSFDGPPVILRGDVVKVSGSTDLPEGWSWAEDAEAALTIVPYYTSVGVVSDFVFLMGPETPSGVQLS